MILNVSINVSFIFTYFVNLFIAEIHWNLKFVISRIVSEKYLIRIKTIYHSRKWYSDQWVVLFIRYSYSAASIGRINLWPNIHIVHGTWKNLTLQYKFVNSYRSKMKKNCSAAKFACYIFNDMLFDRGGNH